MTAVRLHAPATPSAPALLLRPWDPADADELVELYQDDAMRRWTDADVADVAGAARWVRERQRGWESGDRLGFAVVESGADGGHGERLAGHVLLKRAVPGGPSAEVGYWTAARSRGRAVAPRALETLTDWAFAAFGDDGLERLELVHQLDNTASCRVAQKCRYELTGRLPAAPPAYPLDAHVHTRMREPAV
ncbi:Protein N-acetyltransferase, RimJ/RimL family [Streptomyces sp. yr375]|uniref:GNAT family N-acetyltransferase n=1 Tax=Streptomyces sp. yr375 TaxID=1761906 RepID=UPI0008D07C8A|nr:GNAT family N-acetyltransferase [Streptomyces sp. yr375]SES36946.1 Protein N-acetyltransferase, RimJ/RimL family [Streptomyces sp. yr375]